MSSNFGNVSKTGYISSDGVVGTPIDDGFNPASFPFGSVQEVTAIAAVAGGQGSATPVTSSFTDVTSVPAAGDGVLLPFPVIGSEYTLTNSGANAMQVFAVTPSTINGVTSATGVSQAAGTTVKYVVTAAGAYTTIGDLEGGSVAVNNAFATSTTNSTAPAANNVPLSAAQVTGALAMVALSYTGTAGAGFTLTTPTAAQIVAAIPDAVVGQSYVLRVLNTVSTQTATFTANASGVTVTGAATIATTTWRDFVVTLTSLTAVTFTNAGGGSIV